MSGVVLLLERWSAIRLIRRLRQPIVAAAVILAAVAPVALAAISPPESGGNRGATKGYGLLVWSEFLAILLASLAGSGASIAEERRNGTWDAVCLTDLGDGEIARGKLLGSLLAPVLLILLALPSHLAFASRGQARWDVVASIQAVLAGTGLAVTGIGLVASSWTSRALQAVALGAAVVLFPWFAALDWLAARGIASSICRLLHPVRHLEWLLAVGTDGAAPDLGRSANFLILAAIVATAAWLMTAGRLRRIHAGYTLRFAGLPRRRPARTVWDDAVQWRECHEPGGRRLVTVIGCVMALLMVVGVWTAPQREPRGILLAIAERTNALLTTLLLASGFVVGMRAATTLADERARRTIELLFLAGIEPIELVRSKLLAIYRPLRPVLVLVLLSAGLGYGGLVGYHDPAAWLGAAGSVLIVLAYSVMLSGLSLTCSSFAHSMRTALLAGVGLLIASSLGTALVGAGLSPLLPERVGRIAAAASPIMQISIVQHAVTGHHSVLNIPMLLGVLAAEFALGLASIALAAWRLESESRPASCR